MKIFKNFKTKRELREENAMLRAALHQPVQIHTVERNVQKVACTFTVPYGKDIPEEIIKGQIAINMVDCLKPFIEYDFFDDEMGSKIYEGSLCVATKK